MVKNVVNKTKDKTYKTLDDINIEKKNISKPTKSLQQKSKTFKKLEVKEILSNTSTHSSSKNLHLSPVIQDSSLDSNSQEKLCYIPDHIEDEISQKAREIIKLGHQNAFYIMDLQQIRNRYKMWNMNFPNVKMHYAVKSNPDKHLLRELVTLGSNFDCASMEEIRIMLELGATPDRLIFANPVKSEQHIEFAKTKNVKIMTFDCVEEAHKIKKIYPGAEVLLRIAVEATDAPSPMTKKFGAPSTQWNSILDACQKLDLNLRGVSFHVGSGGCSVQSYKDSIQNGKKIFEMAIQKKMKPCDILDIGGGFQMYTGSAKYDFDKIAPQINQLLKDEFPENSNVKLIGEPGRFICQVAQNVVVKVILARQMEECRHYFVNSGVYQAFGTQIFESDVEFLKGQPLLSKDEFNERIKKSQTSYIWGQTCDGVDWLSKNSSYPLVEEGEWLIYRHFGAYGKAVACTFNGFPEPDNFYIN